MFGPTCRVVSKGISSKHAQRHHYMEVTVYVQVIRISGYIASEKVNIARQYLEPQARQATGVPAEAVTISDPAMKTLISEYAR